MDICNHLFKRFGNPLEWAPSQKANLLLHLFFFEQCIYFLSLSYGLQSPELHDLLNVKLAEYHVAYFKGLLMLTLGFIIALKLLQHYWKESTIYEHIAAQHFALSHVYYGYTIGLMSLPVGIVLAGVPVVGFIFFHRKAVVLSFITGIMALIAFSYASFTDQIPYAPLANNLARPDGQIEPLWLAAYSFFAAPHLLFLFAIAFYSLQRWRLREQEIKFLSSTDPLTELMNRRSIMNHLTIEREASARNGHPLSVLMVDLDHFKQINDTWGHNVGDSVLVAAASVLKSTVRENDFVGRYGGEEFLIVLPGLDQENARILAERIRIAVSQISMDLEPNVSLSMTASLGLCCCSLDHQMSSDELIRLADIALYKAKDAGRDQLVIAN